jgi:hypothetical protein
VVGDFGAKIGGGRLRLTGFSSCNASRETTGYQAEGQEQREQSADEEPSAQSAW